MSSFLMNSFDISAVTFLLSSSEAVTQVTSLIFCSASSITYELTMLYVVVILGFISLICITLWF